MTENKNQKSLSIIIPAYNAEKYIERCLSSICNNHIDNIEIIIIDDNSNDGLHEIINRYKTSNNDIIVIKNDKRLGAAASRNIGIDISNGEYIQFVDADDEVDKIPWGKTISELRNKRIDLGIFGSKRNTMGNITRSNMMKEPCDDVLSGWDMFNRIMSRGEMKQPVWLYLIRKDLLERNHLRFKEGIINEDTVFSLRLVTNASTVKYYHNCFGYIHHVNEGSVTFSSALDFAVAGWINIRDMFEMINKESEQFKVQLLVDYANRYHDSLMKKCEKVKVDQIGEILLKKDYDAWKLFKLFCQRGRCLLNDRDVNLINKIKRVIIFGIGDKGKAVAKEIQAMDNVYLAGFAVSDEYWDDPKRQDFIWGAPVKRIKGFENDKNAVIIISTKQYKQKKIKEYLQEKGFTQFILLE